MALTIEASTMKAKSMEPVASFGLRAKVIKELGSSIKCQEMESTPIRTAISTMAYG